MPYPIWKPLDKFSSGWSTEYLSHTINIQRKATSVDFYPERRAIIRKSKFSFVTYIFLQFICDQEYHPTAFKAIVISFSDKK